MASSASFVESPQGEDKDSASAGFLPTGTADVFQPTKVHVRLYQEADNYLSDMKSKHDKMIKDGWTENKASQVYTSGYFVHKKVGSILEQSGDYHDWRQQIAGVYIGKDKKHYPAPHVGSLSLIHI